MAADRDAERGLGALAGARGRGAGAIELVEVRRLEQLAAPAERDERRSAGRERRGGRDRRGTGAPHRARGGGDRRGPLGLAEAQPVRARPVTAHELEREPDRGVPDDVDQRRKAGLAPAGDEPDDDERQAGAALDELDRPQPASAPARPEPDADVVGAVDHAEPARPAVAARDREAPEPAEDQEAADAERRDVDDPGGVGAAHRRGGRGRDDAGGRGLVEHDALEADDRARDLDDGQERQGRREGRDQAVGEGHVPRHEQGRGHERRGAVAGEAEHGVRARLVHHRPGAAGDGQMRHPIRHRDPGRLEQDPRPRHDRRSSTSTSSEGRIGWPWLDQNRCRRSKS